MNWGWGGGGGEPRLRPRVPHQTWPGVPQLGDTSPRVAPSQTWLGGTPTGGGGGVVSHLRYPPPQLDLARGRGVGVYHTSGGGGEYPSQVQLGGGGYQMNWGWGGGGGEPRLRPRVPHQTWPGVPQLGDTSPRVAPSQTWLGGTPTGGGGGGLYLTSGTLPPSWTWPGGGGWGVYHTSGNPPPPRLGRTWPGGGGGGTLPWVVLDTPRSVCLLRSRRRTFLLHLKITATTFFTFYK